MMIRLLQKKVQIPGTKFSSEYFRRLSDRECELTRQHLQKARTYYRQGEYFECQLKI